MVWGYPAELWLAWFGLTHAAGLGGLSQWCTLDGRAVLEQPRVLTEAFNVIRQVAAKALQQQQRQSHE